jgi:hypothetical protein
VGININIKDFKAQFWAIPGPFFIFCILLSIVLNDAITPLILPIVAIIGTIASNLWKWRGVACSSAILALSMVYALQSHASQSWVWIIALTFAIATSFIITALCSEEAYHSWERLNKGSIDYKQAISHLNECYQAAQQKFAAEQNEWNSKLNQLQQQLADKEEKQRSNEQLIKLAKSQIKATLTKQEQLEQDLAKAHQNNATMEAKIRQFEALVDPTATLVDTSKEMEELQSKLEFAENEIEQLHAQLEETHSKEENAQWQIEGLSQEIIRLKQSHEMEAKNTLMDMQKQHDDVVSNLSSRLEIAVLEKEANERKYSSEKIAITEAFLNEKQNLEKSILVLQEELENISREDHEKQERLEIANVTQKALEEHLEKALSQNESLNQKSEELKYYQKECETLQAKLETYIDADQEKQKQLEIASVTQKALEEHLEKALSQNESLNQKSEELKYYQKECETLQAKLETYIDADQEKQKKLEIANVTKKTLEGQLEKALFQNELLHQKNEELTYYQKECENLQAKLKNYIDADQENQELHEKLNQQNQILAIANHEKEHLLEQLERLHEKQTEIDLLAHKKLQEKYEKLLEENELLEYQNEELQKLKNENGIIQQKLEAFIATEQENEDLREKLNYQIETIATAISEKKCLLEQLQQLQEKQKENSESLMNSRELRRIEGLYLQLRQQFTEKSNVLLQTRRELFETQEKLLVFQKEREEAKIDDDKEINESLHRLITAAESEIALVEHQHALEINRLHEVIESLLVKI